MWLRSPLRTNYMAITTIDAFSRSTAAALISGYQKHISPRKGFSCAYRVLHGGESCSHYIKRSILEQGLIEAIHLSKQRFQACKAANQILKTKMQESGTPEEKRKRHRENNAATCTNNPTCVDAGCQSLECVVLDPSTCEGCTSGFDGGALDCGALDCSGLDCGGLDCCSGADFCSCGG